MSGSLGYAPPENRGWCAYFRPGVSSAAFGYLRRYAWWRVLQWLRHKHRRNTWKDIRRQYGGGGWWPASHGRALFNPAGVHTTRYRYRGQQIPAPWPAAGWGHPTLPDGTWGAPVAVRAARRVREAARGNPTAETPAGRPGPTSPLRRGHRPAQPALHGFTQNQIWCELVAMACELTAWMAMLALDGPPGPGNPSDCGCACSPRQGAWPAAAAACGCGSPRPGPGPPRSPPRSPAFKTSPPADQAEPPLRQKGQTTRASGNPAHPARQPGQQARRTLKNSNRPQPNPAPSRSRKIEVKQSAHRLRWLNPKLFP